MVLLNAPIDAILRGRTSVRVLRTLSLFRGKEFTGRELATTCGGTHSKVIGELDRFQELGLVTRATRGRAHVWKANADHEIFRLLAPLFEGEREIPAAFLQELRRGVEDERIVRAILFGSLARGDATDASDVDLLVLAKRTSDLDAVKERLDTLSIRLWNRFGLRLSPVLHPESDLARLQRTSLFANIALEGRLIRGEAL